MTSVRLETGFDHAGGAVSGTQTGLFALEINKGTLAGVHAQVPAPLQSLPRVDAGGRLALPALRDMHIHLDKTSYGGPWRAPESRRGKTILDMIAFEQRALPQMLTTSVEHAEALIRLLTSFGTTHARSHCNIDPVSG
ncbi:deaminase, partial [Xanthomonas citri pv. citri]